MMYFYLLLLIAAAHGITVPTSGSTFNAMWWLSYGETITSCATSGFVTNPTCTAAAQHTITIGAGSAGTSGTVTVYVNGGSGSYSYNFGYSSAISVLCFHGTLSGSTCTCDYGWQGNDCNSLSYLITMPLSGGVITPMNWLSSSESITSCSVAGISPAPSCTYYGTSPYHMISVGAVSAPSQGMITIIVSDGSIIANIQFINTLTSPCVHGRQLSGESGTTCHCQTGYSGSDCQTNECNMACTNGYCGSTILGLNPPTCACNPGYSTKGGYGQCAFRDCNCDGYDNSVCICFQGQGGYCFYSGCAQWNGWTSDDGDGCSLECELD